MTSDNSEDTVLPAARLEFAKGDLIVKEGDYGISIYQILEGKVGIFVSSGMQETLISSLGPDEIIGEMIFLTGYKTRRAATVRAIENSVLEAWHPSRIQREYEAMPFVIKSMANQIVNHLIRVNRMISDLSEKKEKAKQKISKPSTASRTNRRRTFRKSVNLDGLYRPVESGEKVRLWGRIKDISKSGLRLDIRKINALDYPHDIGDEFLAVVFLPTGDRIETRIRIVNKRLSVEDRTMSLGMLFTSIEQDAERRLGFFLLG